MHVISANPCPHTDDAQDRDPSKILVLKTWLMLLYVEIIMHIGSLTAVRCLVQKQAVRPTTTEQVSSLCRAVDLACVFYFKQVLCLQRSAAIVLLLRRYGWDAALVIGVQMLPFESHAWVELQGAVINDKPYMHDIYRVLERC